jgi:hypothetical protein
MPAYPGAVTWNLHFGGAERRGYFGSRPIM